MRLGRFQWIATVLFAVAALFIGSLVYASNLRVVLTGARADDASLVRIRQELQLLGLDVVITPLAASQSLSELAIEHKAAAVIRIESAPPEVVLWIDREHSQNLPQQLRVSESFNAGNNANLLALRAVELLRARLLPVPENQSPVANATSEGKRDSPSPSSLPTPSAAALTATPTVSASPVVPVKRFGVHGGPAVTYSPGGLSPVIALRFGADARIGGPLAATLTTLLPIGAGTVSTADGEMDLRPLSLLAGLSIRVQPLTPLSLTVGAGLGAACFFYQGRAPNSDLARSGSECSFQPYAEFGALYHFTPTFALRSDLMTATFHPHPVLVIANEEAASFGLPGVTLSLAVEVRP
ncbi:MAG: hypothetical protein IPK82_03270 [Polyangiaceae bacterium]|nr:hypothetical protein [Polyangiaceae bacterium]